MTDLEHVKLQEERLVFSHFDETVAFEIGCHAWEIAIARDLPIVVDIRMFDRQMLFLSRPGTSANNVEWVRRKSNTVRRFRKSSYRIALERGEEGVFPPFSGADPADYVIAGGGFPITVKGAGIIGCLTISGLSGEDDHAVAVEALARYLGIEL